VGVTRLSAVWLLVLTASLAGSEPAQRKIRDRTLGECHNAPRGISGESLANILRTEDTIPRLPRAVAELTRFRTGGELLFGESLLVSGLSDDDFFISGERGALFADSRRGLLISCWFGGLLLMDPVVFEFASIESLVFFCVKMRSMDPVD
jgi:hypothetical protein